jgi:phosphopantothenoylcysteine decarboxylase/phosphopantothenate--cysteine ligase
MQPLRNRRVVLGITGGIAAYKSAETARRLVGLGAEVQVVMTRGAQQFVTPLTLQALTGRAVRTDLLDADAEAAMGHIELARWAELVVVAPATAHFIGRLAGGLADDLLTTTCMATAAPIAVAPAMNQQMWKAPATRRNVGLLEHDGVRLWGPGEGEQACGDIGAGRMLEADDIAARVVALLQPGAALAGRHVVVTAGPTREPIDPVRYISNHSSGKQGFAIARAARDAGARVTLVAGPVELPTPVGVDRVDVVSAREMLAAARSAVTDADVLIAVAAVADYRPETVATQKLKKQPGADDCRSVELVANPDIVATLTAERPGLFSVAFAAETERLLEHARAKLERKGVAMIVANDVSDATIGFGSDANRVTILEADGEIPLPRDDKDAVARELIAHIAARLERRAVARTDNAAGS